jgi:hypothetical protein
MSLCEILFQVVVIILINILHFVMLQRGVFMHCTVITL